MPQVSPKRFCRSGMSTLCWSGKSSCTKSFEKSTMHSVAVLVSAATLHSTQYTTHSVKHRLMALIKRILCLEAGCSPHHNLHRYIQAHNHHKPLGVPATHMLHIDLYTPTIKQWYTQILLLIMWHASWHTNLCTA